MQVLLAALPNNYKEFFPLLWQTFEAVSSRDGHLLWNFTDSSGARVEVMNLYTGQFISDLNGDSIPDIINIHGGDPFGQPGCHTLMPLLIVLQGHISFRTVG